VVWWSRSAFASKNLTTRVRLALRHLTCLAPAEYGPTQGVSSSENKQLPSAEQASRALSSAIPSAPLLVQWAEFFDLSHFTLQRQT
jgi:hypothetical protein